MTATAWIALATLSFTVIATVVGAAIGCVIWIGAKFDAHEEKDSARHNDNLLKFSSIDRRLDSLDTFVRNGYGGHRGH